MPAVAAVWQLWMCVVGWVVGHWIPRCCGRGPEGLEGLEGPIVSWACLATLAV